MWSFSPLLLKVPDGVSPRKRSRPSWSGFTLLELLVTLVILLTVLVVVAQFVSEVDVAWKSAAVDPFAEAATAFETITRNLDEATVDSYQDYADSSGAFRTNATATFVPDHLARRSDLAFICGPSAGEGGLLTSIGRTCTGSAVFFIAPEGYTQTYSHAGLGRLLNAMGYFVDFANINTAPAFVSVTPCWRWSLRQLQQPAETLQVYASATSQAWISQAVPAVVSAPLLAQNIITLIVLPERSSTDTGSSLASGFRYDSRDEGDPLTLNQLPPRVRVVLVAMDEASALILARRYGSSPPPLMPAGLFNNISQLDADLAALDRSLTAQKINHRIFEREISLASSAWSNMIPGTP